MACFQCHLTYLIEPSILIYSDTCLTLLDLQHYRILTPALISQIFNIIKPKMSYLQHYLRRRKGITDNTYSILLTSSSEAQNGTCEEKCNRAKKSSAFITWLTNYILNYNYPKICKINTDTVCLLCFIIDINQYLSHVILK